MCGIAGIIDISGAPVDPIRIAEMIARLEHRGPDDADTMVFGDAAIGHARLSIIDTSEKGRQPMTGSMGHMWITYNGEVYNFRELRHTLGGQQAFKSNTDTEVVLRLYEKLGVGAFPELNGIFAFAVYDEREKECVLVRDRLGVKPLYYYDDGEIFLFASEIKALQAHPDFKPVINTDAIHDYFLYGFIPEPATIFKFVHALEPGSYLIHRESTSTIKKYWTYSEPAGEADRTSMRERVRRLDDLLSDAVGQQLLADVEVGAFLSGGVDSSGVVSYASRIRNDLKTFSIVFEENRFDERQFSRRVAKQYGTRHFERTVTEQDLLAVYKRVIAQMDQPYADSSAIPMSLVSELASTEVKVVLSGDGGDELFAGYERDYRFRKVPIRESALRESLRHTLLRARGRRSGISIRTYDPLIDFGNRFSYNADIGTGVAQDVSWFLKGEFISDHAHPYSTLRDRIRDHAYGSMVHAIRKIELEVFLPNDNLVKVDRMSMMHSLEVRVPLLDNRILDFASQLREQEIACRDGGKVILKKVLEKYIPKDILYRKKMGFMIPMDDWMRGALKPVMWGVIEDIDRYLGDWIDVAAVRMLLERHCRGESHGMRLWLFLVLATWYRDIRTVRT